MPFHPRSGLFGFLLLLGALVPSAGQAASGSSAAADPSQPQVERSQAAPAFDSVEARLRRISAALREQAPPQSEEAAAAAGKSTGDKLAWVFVNGPAVGFRNGGFRNGGFGNGGFRNGGFGNGGFRNGGFGNGGFRNGGFRNGGFLNHW